MLALSESGEQELLNILRLLNVVLIMEQTAAEFRDAVGSDDLKVLKMLMNLSLFSNTFGINIYL